MADQTADYYINSTLIAKVSVNVYSAAGGGVLLRAVGKNSVVGEVQSYVTRGNDVWWMLKEGGFVKHGVGLFDAQVAHNTSIGLTNSLIDGAAGGDAQGGIFAELEKFGKFFLYALGAYLAIKIVSLFKK